MFSLPYLHKSRPRLQPLSEAEGNIAHALRRDVQILATDIGPRGTFLPKSYKLAEEFLVSSLSRIGYEVRRLETPALEGVSWNLEATLKGSDLASEIIILGAHYDSMVNCPAANDNASGVAGVLAAALALKDFEPRRTIRFVLFANEEPPHFNMNAMGSQHYAQQCKRAGDDIVGMMCLETIGCYSDKPGSQTWFDIAGGLPLPLPKTGDFIAFVGPAHARRLIKRCARVFDAQRAFPLLAAAAPSMFQHVNWSDHRGFNEVGYQGFMITDTAPLRYQHYHKHTDTPEKLDYDSMARVVRGVIGMVAKLAAQDA